MPLFFGRSLPVIMNGAFVGAFSLAVGALILGVHLPASSLAPLALTVLIAAFSCTGLGLINGAVSLRIRENAVLNNVIFGFLLIFTGANVPLDALPDWMSTLAQGLPFTHAIEAARQLGRRRHPRRREGPARRRAADRRRLRDRGLRRDALVRVPGPALCDAGALLMRARDLNWLQVEEYLSRDDRVVLPIGSTEQHGYLSLETDNILAERVSAEAAEPLGVLVLPVLAYGLTPSFAAYPGSPTLRLETFLAVLRDLLDSLHGQGFRRFLLVNGHGGNIAGRLARARVGGGAPGRAGDLPQLVVERARGRSREADRPGAEPRELVRELPLDAAGRRRPAAGAQAAARRGRLPRRLARGRARAARRRRLRRRLRAAGRAGRSRLATGVEEVRELLESAWR